MKLIPALVLVAFMTSSVVAGEQQNAPATPPVSDASLTSNVDAEKADLHTVGHKQNVCPNCGQVHSGYAVTERRSSAGVFGRVMKI